MFAVALAVALNAPAVARDTSRAAWNRARPGAKAYVAAEEGDVPEARICPTIQMYPRSLRDNDPSGCKIVRQGTAVTIMSIERERGDFGIYGHDLMVAKVRANRGSVMGFIAIELLNPGIPAGADVTLKRTNGDDLNLAPSEGDAYGVGPSLASVTRARVIKYDPASSDAHDLQVRIISGPHAGEIGWVYAQNAFLSDGTPITPLQP